MEAKTLKGFGKYEELIAHYEEKWNARFVVHGRAGNTRQNEFATIQRFCKSFDCYDLSEEDAKNRAIPSGLGAVCTPILKSGRLSETERLLTVTETTVPTNEGLKTVRQLIVLVVQKPKKYPHAEKPPVKKQ